MPEVRSPQGNGRARLDGQAESVERRVSIIACRKRKVIPRIEGSIRQARNASAVRTALGEKLWRRKEAQKYKLGHDRPELWW